MNKLSSYFNTFDKKYSNLKYIDRTWYKSELGIIAYNKKASTRDSKGKFSEEYIRARFLWSLVNSGLYDKEYICVDFGFPKGNSKGNLIPDIIVFKNRDWLKEYEDANKTKDFSKIRKNLLVIFETKRSNKTIESAIENQLRSAMNENTSKDKIFGIYFDDKLDILIFKKVGNSEIRRFDEKREIQQDGIIGWNLDNRDLLCDLPSQKDFIENNASISDLEKLTFDSLDAIDETNFSEIMATLKRYEDSLKPETPLSALIVEFLSLKVFDEKRSKRNDTYLCFYILPKEIKKDGLAEKSFRTRIAQLYKDAQRDYPKVLGYERRLFSYDADYRPSKTNDEKILIAIVEVFQKRAILKAKNESFNQIIFNNFGDEKQKADKGQFFTPIPVVKNMIRMLNPIKGEELCDPCCGICDFLAMAFRYSNPEESEFSLNANNYYGFDLVNNNLKLAELNLVLNGDGGAVLEQMNSLSQKMLHDGSVLSEGEFTENHYDVKTWKNLSNANKDLKKFKIIATNPPFGKGRDLKTGADGKWELRKDTISLYETWKVKIKEKESKDNKKQKIKLPKSMDMGVLFLENSYKILEEGGRMAIVLSNSIASIKEWENVRKWFIERMRIVALFDLPSDTFGESGVATTVIVAYKPKKEELHILNNNYEIFVKDIKNIGYKVKKKQRSIHFEPQYIINENTFEKSNKLDEDFSSMQEEYIEFLKRQEEEIKKAFHFSGL